MLNRIPKEIRQGSLKEDGIHDRGYALRHIDRHRRTGRFAFDGGPNKKSEFQRFGREPAPPQLLFRL